MGMKNFFLAVTVGLGASISSFSIAETFFSDDFDEGLGANKESIWSWQEPYSVDNPFGMMIGEGDIYSVSSVESYNGNSSLRLNFDGRNGWCNACGSDTFFVGNTLDGTTYLRSDSTDFLLNQPDSRRKIFNKDERWAQWTPSEAKSQSLFFENGAPSRNELDGGATFTAGQEVKAAKICGIDGDVGGDINRRSDCNLAINYLEGVSKAQFDFGKTIARRMYLYIPRQTVLPNVVLKLGYTWFEESGSKFTVLPVVSVHRGEKLEVITTALTGSYTFTGITIERDTWYYLEEVYTRESAPYYSDGKYALYFYGASEAKSVPVVSYDNVKYGELNRFAIIGNWQHTNDAEGFFYIDAVAIADRYIGPIEYSGISVSPPNPPEVNIQ
jgi:hypothetical protein